MKKLIIFSILLMAGLNAAEPKFKQQDIDTKVGVGYGLQLADMNGDKKIDIVLADRDKIVWYENPSWKKHQISGHHKNDLTVDFTCKHSLFRSR